MTKRFITVLVVMLAVGGASAFAGKFPNGDVKMMYITNCAECHGSKGRGAQDGPTLMNVDYLAKIDVAKIKKMLVDGIGEKEKRFLPEDFAAVMPPFAEDLTKNEIQALTRLVVDWNK